MNGVSRLLLQASANALPLADESVQCVVTSPPYWGLRQYAGEQRQVWGGDAEHAHDFAMSAPARVGRNDTDAATLARRAAQYGTGTGTGTIPPQEAIIRGGFCACGAWYGALGLEPTPDLYVAHMVEVFREVRRVLRKDGTLWLNLGDSYAAQGGSRDYGSSDGSTGRGPAVGGVRTPAPGLKPKDFVGIPWMVAFALRADGWYLRSDIIWHKPNPMPESVTDRPTKAHEYLFLLTKSERYFYDADAIREPVAESSIQRISQNDGHPKFESARDRTEGGAGRQTLRPDQLVPASGRNKRTVWTIATRPYPGAHFATFPEDLVEPCILAGSSPKACGVCSAPWERVTEREDQGWDGSKYGERAVAATGGAKDGGTARSTLGSSNGKLTGKSTTTGWRPSCVCVDPDKAEMAAAYYADPARITEPEAGRRAAEIAPEPRHCTILDPFNGSGTTGRVAIRHGRSYVGVDISREYLAEQATQRIDNVQHVMAIGGAS